MGQCNTKRTAISNSKLLDAILNDDATAIADWVMLYKKTFGEDAPPDLTIGEDTQPPVLAATSGVCKGALSLSTLTAVIESGFSPNVCSTNELALTPLYIATRNGRDDIVRLLVDAGADVNAAVGIGQRPLIIASASGFIECVRLLLDVGADPNGEKEGLDSTAMHLSVQSGHENDIEISRLLLEHGANINHVNRSGRTALHSACQTRRNVAHVIRFLLANGAEIDVQDYTGSTPLMRALFVGNVKSAKVLLEAGADVNLRNQEGQNARDIALKGTGEILTLINLFDGHQ